MKKTTKVFYFFSFCILNITGAQPNAVIVPTYSTAGHYPCTSKTGHLCGVEVKTIESKDSVEKNVSPINFLKSENGGLIMKVSKIGLSEEQERLYYKNKFSFLIDEDFTLDESIRAALYPDDNKPIVIRKGLYPIVEWDDHYYIRF
jgi:hypothetical protein